MDATTALLPGSPHRRRVQQTLPMHQALPMRAHVSVGVRAPNWMWILGGAFVGAMLLGPIGAVGGAAATGYFLLR